MIHAQVAIFKCGVAQSVTEWPLYRDNCIIVVSSFHLIHFFAYPIVVCSKCCLMAWISVRHLGTRISVTCQNICQCICSVVTWQQNIDNSAGKRFQIVYQTRSAFVQYQNNRLSSGSKCLYKFTLAG